VYAGRRGEEGGKGLLPGLAAGGRGIERKESKGGGLDQAQQPEQEQQRLDNLDSTVAPAVLSLQESLGSNGGREGQPDAALVYPRGLRYKVMVPRTNDIEAVGGYARGRFRTRPGHTLS
jgi:hypothetical protein